MASIKVKFRESTVNTKEGTVFYQIIHERKTKNINTDYRIYKEEWDDRKSKIIMAPKNKRNGLLQSIKERIKWDGERLNKIIIKMENEVLPYTVDDIIDEFGRYSSEYTLFNYMKGIISKLRHDGKIRTSETYKSALNSYRKFSNDEDIMLDCITSDVMSSYEAWHRHRGVSPNTTSFYTRILRAVYNRAVEQGIIENKTPFRHVYTGVGKTIKRALPLETIKKIRHMDLSLNPRLDYARDMFIMSFMLRGMSFIDMAFLRKSDLVNGFITYRRRKTGQQLTIAWTKEMQKIIDKYPENSSDYLLPIIKDPAKNERTEYCNMGYNINYSLKALGRKAGVSVPLTLYVARHSWASVAHTKGIPLGVISEGMGHDSESTTRIYLASLDTSVVDKANEKIIKSL